MTDTELRISEMIRLLKQQNFRLTPQRVELVRLIAISYGHPSAAQLFAQIKEKFPTMSQATVYKTIALLKELKQVLEIDLRDDSHYDGNRPDAHPHLVCTQCNQIVDGDLEIDPARLSALEESTGYKITKPQITFYGFCPTCRAGI